MTFVQPKLRALQSVREASGKYKATDAVGFTLFKAQQTANIRPTYVPKETIWYNGSSTANPS